MNENLKTANGLFVTGTDTGVGKTLISAALVARLKGSYWKPVQTGPEDDHDAPEVQRLSACGLHAVHPSIYRFPEPLSPHEAARLANDKIDFHRLEMPPLMNEEFLIVEGAGGVLVPLNDSYLMIDLMVRLDQPVLIVARSGLGTINHTLLTIEAVRRRGLRIVGVIMNGPENSANRKAIEKYGRVEVLAEVPPLEKVSYENLQSHLSLFDRVAELFGRSE